MAYIEAHQQLREHPKTKKAARRLGISIPQMVGHVMCLWWWALDYAPHGDLARYDAEDIAEAAMWESDAEAFTKVLREVGFLDITEDGLVIHDWWEYAGKLVEKRENDAARKRAERASRRGLEPPPSPPSNASNVRPTDIRVTAQVAKLREEKQREAYTDDRPKSDDDEEASVPSPPAQDDPPVNLSPKVFFSETTEAYKLAHHLRTRIVEHHPRARVPRASPGDLQVWCRAIDGMLRIDGRSEDEIRRVIDFSQSSSFWRTNILSAQKLREKFDTLWLQMTEPKKGPPHAASTHAPQARTDRAAAHDALEEQRRRDRAAERADIEASC